METQKFTRVPFEIEAVEVTPTNCEEVAKWCRGTATEADYRFMGGVHKMGAVLLPKQGPNNDRVYTVLIGQWITKHNKTFRSWSKDNFEKNFRQIVKPGDYVLTTGTDTEFDGWEGEVKDGEMIGVDFGKRGKVLVESDKVRKIARICDAQRELNGLTFEFDSIIEQMRHDNREALEAMQVQNDRYASLEIKVGDLVKIVENEPLDARGAMYLGLSGEAKAIEDDVLVKVEFEMNESAIAWFSIHNLEKLPVGKSDITVGQARVELGMEPTGVPEVDEQKLSPAAAESFARMKASMKEEAPLAHFSVDEDGMVHQLHSTEVPKVGPNQAKIIADRFLNEDGSKPETVEIDSEELEVEHMVEVNKPDHERHGQTGKITVIGMDRIDGTDGVEILYSDGEYDCFKPSELKKI